MLFLSRIQDPTVVYELEVGCLLCRTQEVGLITQKAGVLCHLIFMDYFTIRPVIVFALAFEKMAGSIKLTEH